MLNGDRSLILSNVFRKAANGKEEQLELFFISGRMILYIHIPNQVHIAKHLQHYVRFYFIMTTFLYWYHMTTSSRIAFFPVQRPCIPEPNENLLRLDPQLRGFSRLCIFCPCHRKFGRAISCNRYLVYKFNRKRRQIMAMSIPAVSGFTN